MFVRRLERHLTLWLGMLLAFLLLNALLWYWVARRLDVYRGSLAQAHETLARLSDADAALSAAQRRRREYLLAADESTHAAYQGAAARLRSNVEALDRLMANGNSARLHALAADALDALDQTIHRRREQGADGARPRGENLEGPGDALRALIADLSRAEYTSLKRREEALETMLRRATVAFGLATLVLAGLIGFVGHLLQRDARERRRAEDELREAKESAESASRAKDQFLAMLSHELRTPLSPVLLSATAALVDSDTPAALRPTFEMIRRNVELEARLIDDLLDVMRIIRGKLPFEFEVVDVHTLLHQTLEICRSEMLSRRLDMVLELHADEHHVRGDPARLQQVFWNLAKNATKFTPEGGRIVLGTYNHDHRVAVEFRDTGVGFAPELLPRIFNAFEQGTDARTQKLGGLGLGLAICRSIAEAHDAVLTAHSGGPGKGATFSFEMTTVPPSPRRTPAAGPDSATATAHPPRRILLVEDDPMTLRVLSRLLRQVGHDVTAAAGYNAALAAARDDTEIVISDIGLPDGSGLDLMRALRARHPRLLGIALTGFGMDDDLAKSREAGYMLHLTKPIDFPKLEAAIQKLAATR